MLKYRIRSVRAVCSIRISADSTDLGGVTLPNGRTERAVPGQNHVEYDENEGDFIATFQSLHKHAMTIIAASANKRKCNE
jgi:hypothetical protein